nr:hypothetical protein BHI3_28820 [Bacteriovorax sp. HI3]
MLKHFLTLLLLLSLSSCALLSPNPIRQNEHLNESPVLVPFTTDYCSEWPDGKKENPEQWAGCCFTHDLHYWIGGTDDERKKSDEELKECVKMTGSSLSGFLMYIGVRFGGRPGDASYSWGYGWTKGREYAPISKEQAEKARGLLMKSERNKNKKEKKLIDDFVKNSLDIKIQSEDS